MFQIAAIALFAVGAYVQIKLVDYYDFFGNEYTGPGILLIVVGVFIFIIAFFGCMGALKENYCLTMSVSILCVTVTSVSLCHICVTTSRFKFWFC